MGVGISIGVSIGAAAGGGGSAVKVGNFRFVMLGQSEMARSVINGHNQLGNAGTVTDENALTVIFREYSGAGAGQAGAVQTVNVNNTTKVSAHMVEMSNTLAAIAPGSTFRVAFMTRSSTGMAAALDDASTSRTWSEDADIYTALAGVPDAVIVSWHNKDGDLGDDYGSVHYSAFSAKRFDTNAALSAGDTYVGQDFDHFYTDLWPASVPVYECNHRYDQGPSQNARYNQVRASQDEMALSTSAAAENIYRGWDGISYEMGDDPDNAHPSTTSTSWQLGMGRFVKHWAHWMADIAGIRNFSPPLITSATWTTSTVTLSSSYGDITTPRIVAGESLPAGRPVVDGIFLNGTKLTSGISISGGNIVVSGSFVRGDIIEYWPGRAGNDNSGSDLTDKIWKDTAGIAYANVSGIETIDLRGAPPQANLTNTLTNDPTGGSFSGHRYSNSLIPTNIGAAPWSLAVDSDGFHNNISTDELYSASSTAGFTAPTAGTVTFCIDVKKVPGVEISGALVFYIRGTGTGGSGFHRCHPTGFPGDVSISNSTGTTARGAIRIDNWTWRVWGQATFAGTDCQIRIDGDPAPGYSVRNPAIFNGALSEAEIRAL